MQVEVAINRWVISRESARTDSVEEVASVDTFKLQLNKDEMGLNILGIFLAVFLLNVRESEGHGMLLSPVSRGSRWRYDSKAPTNFNDNELYCGGFSVSTQTRFRSTRSHYEIIFIWKIIIVMKCAVR